MKKFYPMRAADSIFGTRPLSYREQQLRKEISDWAITKFGTDDRFLFAMTATCKRAIKGPLGNLIWLTAETLENELKVFFRRIDWQLFKNASKRHGKCIERFCTIEGGGYTGKRIHVHALVLGPPVQQMHPTRFIRALKSHWVSSPWGRRDVLFDLPASPLAAARYITKTGLDAVAWSSTELDSVRANRLPVANNK